MSATSVLIVGAGPTGLVLALRLAHHGVPFRIIEKNAGPGQASRAMAVQARTLEFYDQICIADPVVAAGIKMERVHLKEDGDEVSSFALKDIGAGLSPFPFMLCFPQDDHERFLVERLAEHGIQVEWGTELKEFSQDDNAVRAVLHRNGVEEVCVADYLAGCDGAHSTVRQALNVGFPGGTYDQLFYVADVKLVGGGDNDLYANMGAQGIGLVLPVRSSGMKRLIGTVPEAQQHNDHITFPDIQTDIEKLLDLRVEQVNWFSIYHVHHRVASHFRVGRVFLAGDAGHIHSPAGAQGMNTGIGDAVNLSWKLAHVLQKRASPFILDSYESERIAFARVLVESTDRAFQGMVDKSWAGRLARTLIMPTLAPLVTRFSAVRRAIFNTVSQVRINYRHSVLSEGDTGDIEGGDRLPWVTAPETGNFPALRSLDWQLHVYGEASAGLQLAAQRLGLATRVYPWSEAAAATGLRRDAAYLIRPDAHIGLAMPTQDEETLHRYVDRLGLVFDKEAATAVTRQ